MQDFTHRGILLTDADMFVKSQFFKFHIDICLRFDTRFYYRDEIHGILLRRLMCSQLVYYF